MSHSALSIGDTAPDFTLDSTSGESVHLYEQLRHRSVVLFFYVAAFTPVCSAEVCSFRKNSDDFTNLNAAIFGIGSGLETVTKKFASYYRLPFPLLLDRENRVRHLYGVRKAFGLFPGRFTYLIGQDRKLLHITHASFDSAPHIQESLNFLRSMRPE